MNSIVVSGSIRPADAFNGQITQNIIYRRAKFSADNCGGIGIKSSALREVIIEHCTALHPASAIKVEKAGGVLIRNCRSANGELPCEGMKQEP
jgi:hypothetical protein